MRIARRTLLSTTLAATLLVGPVTAAGAHHTGCDPHHTTGTAHDAVPGAEEGAPNQHGLHTAHGSIPYCPPEDAPRHGGGGHGNGNGHGNGGH